MNAVRDNKIPCWDRAVELPHPMFFETTLRKFLFCIHLQAPNLPTYHVTELTDEVELAAGVVLADP